jgi:hypothetical protein
MKRPRVRERDEAAAREVAERRTEDLLTQLKDREAAARRENQAETASPVTEAQDLERSAADDEPPLPG